MATSEVVLGSAAGADEGGVMCAHGIVSAVVAKLVICIFEEFLKLVQFVSCGFGPGMPFVRWPGDRSYCTTASAH